MKEFRIYTGSREDVLETVSYYNGEKFIHVKAERDSSLPAYIDVAGIRLESHYDNEQTLIPGVTRRVVKYVSRDITFAEIRWNEDQTYLLKFPDEEVQATAQENHSFLFEKDGEKIAVLSPFEGHDVIVGNDGSWAAVFTVEAEDEISQQALYLILSFPVLYFGFGF